MTRSLATAWALTGILTAQQPEPGKPLPKVYESIVITASPLDPAVERRNKDAFEKTLFSRDDQVFHLLEAGINAGQHEGGGKSLEIRRYGFNLDHGGVSGGLKVLVDNVQQNQSTQGHGQGYLGSLKSMSPELIADVDVHNGPFRAEYGDFSGLGVVHIRQRESMPDEFTVRLQGGSFGSRRGFFAWSPGWRDTDAFLAYEGSLTDGPFQKPLGYRRDNVTGNFTRRIGNRQAVSLKLNAGRSDFDSSGQLPLDEVEAGRLDRFGYLDPGDGGRVRQGTMAGYWRREDSAGGVWKLDGFLTRSLFDLYSNFTFFLNDSVNGDGIQQHDSRLVQGANTQYIRPHKKGSVSGIFTGGGNLHATQTLVGLYSRVNRTPLDTTTLSHASVTNGAGYAQEDLSFLGGKLRAGGGLRYDGFRFNVADRIDPTAGGIRNAGRWQPKAHLAWTPSWRAPVTLHANYGRGISSLDARGVVQASSATRIATTDFLQTGVTTTFGRWSVVADGFWIDRSNELVYIPDDGSLEFLGPTRAYGFELKASLALTRRVSLHGGLTKVLNAFYRGTAPREYVDRAPHFTANAGLTVSAWRGWTASARMRTINHYRLDPLDDSFLAAGHVVFDAGISRPITRKVEFHAAVDNFTNRAYFETQNYFESRLAGQAPAYRIHATPGFPVTVTVGMTFRFRGK